MKITLISTSTFPSDQGIRTISAVLKKAGHKVELVFMALSEDYSINYSESELKQLEAIAKGSQLIGVTSYASTAKRAERIITFLKKMNIPIIYGGVHPTISPEQAITISDLVCVGEGEEAVIELANALEKNKSFDNIKNLWIRKSKEGTSGCSEMQEQKQASISDIKKGEGIIKNPIRNLIENVDALPFPDFDIETHYLLEKGSIRKFKEEDLGGGIFFLTGRGCPYGCDYCSNSFFNQLYKGKCKKILRLHSPEYIIKGILYMKNKFPTLSYFDIRDDTFSMRPLEEIKKFCGMYKKQVHLRFKCLGDPKTITDEKIKLLVDAGCTDIIIGIQGSESTNHLIYHRNQTDEGVLKAAQILNKYRQLAVMYDVITSNPYETPEQIISLIRLLQKLPRPYYLSVNNLVFFPGTQLYRRAIQDGTIKTEKDTAQYLNYWDRSKHILLKGKNIYLNLILNLMRGPATEQRFGLMPSFLLNWLLEEERVKRNLKNQFPAIAATRVLYIFDLVRERILKPAYRSMPLSFKVWYDQVRYHV